MGRWIGLGLAGLLATQAGCAPLEGYEAQLAEERAMERRIARAVRADPRLTGCGDLRKVDFRRLPPEAASRTPPTEAQWTADAARHLEARGPYGAFAAPDDASVVLSMYAGATGHQMQRTDTSSVVWRGADGVWRVNAVDHRVGGPPVPPRPPGEPPYTPDERARMERKVIAGVLAAEQAAVLDAAISDVCLELQPDHVPIHIPLLGGTADFCYGGTGGMLSITFGDRRRMIGDTCARYVAGKIMNVVMYPRITAPDA